MRAAPWFSAKRIRIHALLLAICLWTIYAIDMSAPGMIDRNGLVKGTDFLHFYTLGNLALHGRGDLLYDMRAQAELTHEFVAHAPDSVYVSLYGPQMSLFFEPFARLPYGMALTGWLLLNLVIYAFCCYAVYQKCPNLHAYRWTIVILAIAFPGLFHLLAWGQTSGLALLCFTLAFLALENDRPLLAGLAIGSLIFKPQLAIAAAVVFVFTRQWKVTAGAMMAATLQLIIAWMHYGSEVMRAYWHALTHVKDVMPLLEPRLYQTHSLRSFWSLLLPWQNLAFILYAASALAVVVFTVRVWKTESKSESPLAPRFSALLLATVLVSPHLTVYDLAILAPAFLLLGDWALSHTQDQSAPQVQHLLYFCYPLFLIGPLARITHLQLSVVAMTALLWIVCRISARMSAPTFTRSS
jgi:alpha-1,2-mannosyltransferase